MIRLNNLIIIFFIFSVLGCSAPKPKPVPKFKKNKQINNYFEEENKIEKVVLNEFNNKYFNFKNKKIIYAFSVNDNDEPIITVPSEISFFYYLQHADVILIETLKEKSFKEAFNWLIEKGIERQKIKYKKTLSKNVNLIIYRSIE